MDTLYEMREKVVRFFNKYENYIQPVLKLVIALLLFFVINSRWGYMQKLDRTELYLVLSFVCCILPPAAIIIIAVSLILLHLYALSMAACIVAAGLFFLMYVLYYRFDPESSFYTALTPISYIMGIPYIMPIAAGFLKKPSSAMSMVCATVTFYFLDGIYQNKTVLGGTNSKETMVPKIQAAIKQLIGNREMFLMCAVMIVTTTIVYCIRRLSIEYAWTIALFVGTILEMVLMIVGTLVMRINIGIISLLMGMTISFAIGWGIKFICFHLDYARTEHVQFEDDEYYYYVKAVPKILYPVHSKKIKKP